MGSVCLDWAMVLNLTVASCQPYYWLFFVIFSLLAVVESPFYLLAHFVDFCKCLCIL